MSFLARLKPRPAPPSADERFIACLQDLDVAGNRRELQRLLDLRLRELHSVGELDAAGRLVRAFTPEDACRYCDARGAGRLLPGVHAPGTRPAVCEDCDGTGQRSRSLLLQCRGVAIPA